MLTTVVTRWCPGSTTTRRRLTTTLRRPATTLRRPWRQRPRPWRRLATAPTTTTASTWALSAKRATTSTSTAPVTVTAKTRCGEPLPPGVVPAVRILGRQRSSPLLFQHQTQLSGRRHYCGSSISMARLTFATTVKGTIWEFPTLSQVQFIPQIGLILSTAPNVSRPGEKQPTKR